MKNLTAHCGFNLIEMMVVMMLVTLTSHWMLMNYQIFIAKEKRHEAESALFNLAASLEAFALSHGSYQGASLSTLKIDSFTSRHSYHLKITKLTNNHFIVSANPQSQQADIDKACGMMSLSSEGRKSASGTSGWQRCW